MPGRSAEKAKAGIQHIVPGIRHPESGIQALLCQEDVARFGAAVEQQIEC